MSGRKGEEQFPRGKVRLLGATSRVRVDRPLILFSSEPRGRGLGSGATDARAIYGFLVVAGASPPTATYDGSWDFCFSPNFALAGEGRTPLFLEANYCLGSYCYRVGERRGASLPLLAFSNIDSNSYF
jgi:hypothetical protein